MTNDVTAQTNDQATAVPEDTCSSPEQMMMSLLDNVIQQDTYTQWVSNYFKQDTPPPPKVFTADFIKKQITIPGSNCGSYIEVYDDNPDKDNNDDIIFNVISAELIDPDLTRYYTITLFNAFFAILNPIMEIESFGFTKANQSADGIEPGSRDIIFQINFKDQATTYWDLSGTVPPIKHK